MAIFVLVEDRTLVARATGVAMITAGGRVWSASF